MITSSPGLTTAFIAEIIASVAPHVTVTFFSGLRSMPLYHLTLATMASRRFLLPHVMAYWLTSCWMASMAACLISAGAGKSGNPCAKFMEPGCCLARRVISRITDSVNCSATRDNCMRRDNVGGIKKALYRFKKVGCFQRVVNGAPRIMFLETNLAKMNEKYNPLGIQFVQELDNTIRILQDNERILGRSAPLWEELNRNFRLQWNGSQKFWFIAEEEVARLEGRSWKFKPTTDPEELKTTLFEFVDLIEEEDLKTSVVDFLNKTPYFFEAPAAKGMHHNYRHGLLEHTVQTVQMASLIAKNMAGEIGGSLDFDLIIAGSILHDCGKINDYVIRGDVISTTEIHLKQDHIINGVKIVSQEIKSAKLDELIHIIASHHNLREWGSPVEPKTPEAWIIHTLENLSSKIMG